MYKIGGAHLQCVNNHYAKFEYKRMKTVWSYRLNKPDTPYAFRMINMSKFNTPLSNVHKMGGANLQCVNNHYAKLENKVMKTVAVTEYTNHTLSKHFWMEKCLTSKALKIEKTFMKCAQNSRCTSSICEQSLCKA